MVRPSPFCFLDEIDAALDEQNVVRFVNLLREFGRMSQFVVITHNKKTVTGANALLGVTMEESGVTKVIAVRLERSDGKPVPPPACRRRHPRGGGRVRGGHRAAARRGSRSGEGRGRGRQEGRSRAR